MEILAVIVIIQGLILGFLIAKLFGRQSKYVGNIVVTKREGITLFSLEVDDNPEKLALEKEVTFKVLIPEEESDRE